MPRQDHRPALVAFMAAAAVLAVLVVNHPLVRPARDDFEVSAVAPEGRHGVPEAELFSSRASAPLADAGARLGSE
jgi:hypothetical protein